MFPRYLKYKIQINIACQVISFGETDYFSLPDVEGVSISPSVKLQTCVFVIVLTSQPVVVVYPFCYLIFIPIKSLSDIKCMYERYVIMIRRSVIS